ncbi:MAG: sugar ABC transporter permease [Chloroflexia bacterium]|nr:sugar ABC transporter permease [Chloroflexia bacterium]
MSATAEARNASGTRPTTVSAPSRSIWRQLWRDRWMYLLMLPGLLYFILFHYVPMLGNVVAFQDYSPFLGFWRSPWVGWDNFRALLGDPDVANALRNTLIINVIVLVVAFPAAISLALVLNSLLNERIKRLLQSVLYLPHFLSWVIVISIWQELFGGAGFVNQVTRAQGLPGIDIMTNPDFFKFLVAIQYIWKEVGWDSILILAALTTIDPTLYEAAALDGAGPWQRLLAVTLPGIRGVVLLLLILWLGTFLTTGFEQFYLQRNAVGAQAAEVLDTFTYFRGVRGGDWGLAAAVGLLKGVFGAIVIFSANALAKRFGEEGVF